MRSELTAIAVVGATGFVGRHLVRRLATEGSELRCVVRDPGRATSLLPAAATMVRADILEPASLGRALAGAGTVVHCAAITADRKEAYSGQYRRVNAEGTRNLVEAAEAAGVTKIVLVNGLGTRPGREGSYMRTRWEMAEAVRSGGLAWVALQPSILFGDDAPFPKALAQLARRYPVMPVLGRRRRLQPLWIEDLVTCLALAVRQARWDGRAVDLGGPEQLTFAQMADLVMKTIGVRRPKAPVPLPVARVQSRLMMLLPNPLLVPATLELFDFDNVTELDAVETHFGFQPRSIREHFSTHGLNG